MSLISYLIYQSALCFLFVKSRVDISNRLVEISDEPLAIRLIKYLRIDFLLVDSFSIRGSPQLCFTDLPVLSTNKIGHLFSQ